MESDKKLPNPPKTLSREARRWWRRIVAEWHVEAEGLLLLQAALECWDRYVEARDLLAADGPVVTNPDSGVQRVHPASHVARDSLREFRQLWRQLGLVSDFETQARIK